MVQTVPVLVELHLENLGVIESADLVLGDGTTALTGETGAGKTLLVEAIVLLSGGRADATIVRHGAPEARVDARLVADGRELVVSRVVPADGRSRAYVDGRPVSVTHLAELCRAAIDLHGQHAHQRLLTRPAQRDALDAAGAVDLGELRAARAALTEVEAALATLGGDERARARERDLVAYQVAELDAAAIADPDEDDRLAEDEAVLADASTVRERAFTALAALVDDDGAGARVDLALQHLDHRGPLAAPHARLVAIGTELDDLMSELRDAAEQIDDDPERLSELRERRQLLVGLRRKYGADLAEVMAFHDDARRRLVELDGFEQRAAELDRLRHEAVDRLRAAEAAVGDARRAAAPALAAQVTERLRQLAMPDAEFVVDLPDASTDPAADRLQFLLAANPGTPPLPLSKVASGGELARVMLALRLVLTPTGDGSTTLVFDEVDAGIGGSAATAVGRALADLGRGHQVLVVTHLAQVAAAADHQIAVEKSVREGSTVTSVEHLDGRARAAEIARMLAGDDTATALDHAGELLDEARASRHPR